MELALLQMKATEVKGYINELKKHIDKNPVNINNIPLFYLSKECWDWDPDCEPTGSERYYSFLLYYREVLKQLEKEIHKEKQKISKQKVYEHSGWVCVKSIDHYEVWLEANYDTVKHKPCVTLVCRGSKNYCKKMRNKHNKKLGITYAGNR